MNTFLKTIADTSKLANDKLSFNDNDYEQDGLIYCGNCHRPKQVRINKGGVNMIFRCVCECEKKAADADIMAIYKEQKEDRIKANKRIAFNGSALIDATFDSDDGETPDLVKTAKGYVANFHNLRKKGKGFVFWGECDTGKTFVAACILNALIEKGYTAKLLTFSEIENSFRNELHRLWDYDIICIDDFGTERKTSYMQELIFRVINDRYDLKKPMILTTNLTADNFKNPQDTTEKRIFDRLKECCFFKQSRGGNHRKKIMIEDYKKYKDLLNL